MDNTVSGSATITVFNKVSQTGYIAKGREYNGISSGTTAQVTPNSSITVAFETTFTPETFSSITPSLKVCDAQQGQPYPLPANTKITMIDMTASTPEFFSHIASGLESEIALSSFTAMSNSDAYGAKTGSMPINEKILFVIDFAQSSAPDDMVFSLVYMFNDTATAYSTDIVSTRPVLTCDIGTDTTLATVTAVSSEVTPSMTNSFDLTVDIANSTPYANTQYEENSFSAVITLDEDFGEIPSGTFAQKGTQMYSANGGVIIVPVSAGQTAIKVVSPTFIDGDMRDKVVWNVKIVSGGSEKSPISINVASTNITFDNDESSAAYLVANVDGAQLITNSTTSKDFIVDYSNISSIDVTVDVKSPTTGEYVNDSSLSTSLSLQGSGNSYTVNIGSGNAVSGTTYRVTFYGKDSSGNVVEIDKCYLVTSFIKR